MDFGKLKLELPKTEFNANQMDDALKADAESNLIRNVIEEHKKFKEKVQQANRYFIGYNDILLEDKKERIDKRYEQLKNNPLRNADNKEPHGYYPILVEQKIAFGFADQILLRSENNKYNDELLKLSNLLYKQIDTLALYASNAGFSWLYYYIDKDKKFKLATYESSELAPFYDYSEGKILKYMLRYFEESAILYAEDGIRYYKLNSSGVYEKQDKKATPYFYKVTLFGKNGQSWNRVPFVRFNNGLAAISDLTKVKPFIDAYDMVVSNYVNDVEDLQQLIFILINYGGQDLTEFLEDLRKYKAIKVKKTKDGAEGGVETLKVDIPVEARVKLLEIIDENIWNIGQGVNPKLFKNAGNLSMVGIQELYGLLELKTSLMILQFRDSIAELIEAFNNYLKITKQGDFSSEEVEQVYTRTMIKNDKETIENCKNSYGVISNETIWENHPWVADVEKEKQRIADEKAQFEEYNETFETIRKNNSKVADDDE